MVCLSNAGILDHYWIDSRGTGLVNKALDMQALLEGRRFVNELYKQISINEIENNDNILFSSIFINI